MAGKPTLRLPAKPLLDRIARNGGLVAVMERAGIPTRGDRRDGTSREFHRYQSALEEAAKIGSLTFWKADAFVIELLQVHPLSVYGEDLYFNPIDPNAVEENQTDEVEPVLARAA